MVTFVVSPEVLAMVVGILLSLLFSYVPGLNVKFAALEPEVKRLIMLGLLFLASAAIYAGTCVAWFDSGITCDQSGLFRLVMIFIYAMITNQSTYQVSPQTASVRAARK